MTIDTVLTDEDLHHHQGQHLNTIGPRDAQIASCIKAGRAIEQAVLQSYESQLLRLLVDIRFAAGDDGKRMQPELVEHIAALRKDAERLRYILDRVCMIQAASYGCKFEILNLPPHFGDCEPDPVAPFLSAIDAAMEKQP